MRAYLMVHGWLIDTPESFRLALLAEASPQRYERGAFIYREGDPTGGLFGLVDGAVGFEIAPYERGPNFAHVFRPGSWFGEMEILCRSARAYSLVALRPSVCLHVPLRNLEAVMCTVPAGWRYLGALCADHLGTAIGTVDDLMIRDTAQRVAAVILRLADCRARDNVREQLLEIDASQEDLAVMTNLGRAAITRCLADLEAAGFVRRGYRRLVVTDPSGLRQFLAPPRDRV